MPKITDFGLAKRLESDDRPDRDRRRSWARPATWLPSRPAGHTKDVGPAADIYALGAILYEMLTGRPPFKGETPMETVRQVIDDDPVPPSRLVPRLARDLETICLKCLQQGPAKALRIRPGPRRRPGSLSGRRADQARRTPPDRAHLQVDQTAPVRRHALGRRRRGFHHPALHRLLVLEQQADAGTKRLATPGRGERADDCRAPPHQELMSQERPDRGRGRPDGAARRSLITRRRSDSRACGSGPS